MGSFIKTVITWALLLGSLGQLPEATLYFARGAAQQRHGLDQPHGSQSRIVQILTHGEEAMRVVAANIIGEIEKDLHVVKSQLAALSFLVRGLQSSDGGDELYGHFTPRRSFTAIRAPNALKSALRSRADFFRSMDLIQSPGKKATVPGSCVVCGNAVQGYRGGPVSSGISGQDFENFCKFLATKRPLTDRRKGGGRENC